MANETNETFKEEKRTYDALRELADRVQRAMDLVLDMIAESRQRLRDACEHSFSRENDGDFHNIGFFYRCDECGLEVDAI